MFDVKSPEGIIQILKHVCILCKHKMKALPPNVSLAPARAALESCPAPGCQIATARWNSLHICCSHIPHPSSLPWFPDPQNFELIKCSKFSWFHPSIPSLPIPEPPIPNLLCLAHHRHGRHPGHGRHLRRRHARHGGRLLVAPVGAAAAAAAAGRRPRPRPETQEEMEMMGVSPTTNIVGLDH